MTRYVLIFLISALFAPAFAIAATSPAELSRDQQMESLQGELRLLLAEYQKLLSGQVQIHLSSHTTSAPVSAKKSVPVVRSAPVMFVTTTALEDLVLQFSNDARKQNGLSPLSSDAALASLARGHSQDMLDHNYFDHKDPSGCNSTCRMNKSGYAWQKMGENIHMTSGYAMSDTEMAHKIVNDWLNSPSHRANLLNPSFTHVGIGIARSGSTIYTSAEYSLPL